MKNTSFPVVTIFVRSIWLFRNVTGSFDSFFDDDLVYRHTYCTMLRSRQKRVIAFILKLIKIMPLQYDAVKSD